MPTQFSAIYDDYNARIIIYMLAGRWATRIFLLWICNQVQIQMHFRILIQNPSKIEKTFSNVKKKRRATNINPHLYLSILKPEKLALVYLACLFIVKLFLFQVFYTNVHKPTIDIITVSRFFIYFFLQIQL